MTAYVEHVTDLDFPFKATLTHPVGEFDVETSVTVVGYDDPPHSYVVKHGSKQEGGVSPLWLAVEPVERDDAVLTAYEMEKSATAGLVEGAEARVEAGEEGPAPKPTSPAKPSKGDVSKVASVERSTAAKKGSK